METVERRLVDVAGGKTRDSGACEHFRIARLASAISGVDHHLGRWSVSWTVLKVPARYPASISGNGTSTLTMNTTTSTVPWALSLTITGTSGTLSHTGSSTLLVDLAPPSNPTAIAGDRQVSLSWGASVEASSYHVRRATVSGGPYEPVACLAATATSYTDSALVDGTTYTLID